MNRIIYITSQGIWGCIQNLAGLVMFLYIRRKHPEYSWNRYRNSYVLHWNRRDSVAVGSFIFFGHQGPNSERMLKHEYGHTLQSAVLGPLYLLIIGIPSYMWANGTNLSKRWRIGECSYFDFYTERWADSWGGVGSNEIREL